MLKVNMARGAGKAESPDPVRTTLEPDLGNPNVGKRDARAYLRVGFCFWRGAMLVKINGEETSVRDGATMGEVLSDRTTPGNPIVVLCNGEIVTKEEWQMCRLCTGDRVEIVRIVGGG